MIVILPVPLQSSHGVIRNRLMCFILSEIIPRPEHDLQPPSFWPTGARGFKFRCIDGRTAVL